MTTCSATKDATDGEALPSSCFTHEAAGGPAMSPSPFPTAGGPAMSTFPFAAPVEVTSLAHLQKELNHLFSSVQSFAADVAKSGHNPARAFPTGHLFY